jgi:hypothetical protein
MDLNVEELKLIAELAYDQFSIAEIAIIVEKPIIDFENEFNERGTLWRLIEGNRLQAVKEVRDKIFTLAKAGDAEMISQAQKLIMAQKLQNHE